VATSDSIRFNYVFGSEEYMEFVSTTPGGINDGFGFFISGPGISGPFSGGAQNIAIVPGTSLPVTMFNLNLNTNSAFYFDNGDGFGTGTAPDGLTVQYDGFTLPLVAAAAVQCGQTYHIKLAIADGGDYSLDSGVFIEEGSFTSTGNVYMSSSTSFGGAVSGNDTTIYEGCGFASILFDRGLNNLSVALGDIAQALADKSEASSATAKAMKGGDFISEIKEINIGVKALQKDTKEILANQQTIMKMGSSKAKDSKTSDVENMGKDKKSQSAFKEGIGVILLIAVAVLALGVAFNIVGKVNFLSVIALALALPLLAIGFSKVLTTLKTVGFNAKEDGKNFLIAIGVIALSITMASWILGMIIPLSFTKAMTKSVKSMF
jgi:hypothetical protein